MEPKIKYSIMESKKNYSVESVFNVVGLLSSDFEISLDDLQKEEFESKIKSERFQTIYDCFDWLKENYSITVPLNHHNDFIVETDELDVIQLNLKEM